MGAAIAVALLAALFLFCGRTEPAEPSIAVLPFENMTGDADWDYTSATVSRRSVINSLSRIPGLRVRPQLQSFPLSRLRRKRWPTLRPRSSTLRFIVAGSVRTSGQNVRLAAQLIDPMNGENLQSVTEEYSSLANCSKGRMRYLAQSVASVVLDAANLPPFTFETSKYKPDAGGLRSVFTRPPHLASTWQASRCSRRSITSMRRCRLTPDFARGWAALATAYLTYPSYSPRGYATWNDAEPAAQKALELDPDIADAYGVLATFRANAFRVAKGGGVIHGGSAAAMSRAPHRTIGMPSFLKRRASMSTRSLT